MVTDRNPGFEVIVNSQGPEEDSLPDLLTAESLHLVGVLANNLSGSQVRDTVKDVESPNVGDDQDLPTTPALARARRLLIGAEIIMNPIFLQDSPGLRDTSEGRLVAMLTSLHLKALHDAHEIERSLGDMTAKERFSYLQFCSSPYRRSKPSNITRIIDELFNNGKLPKAELDSIRNIVGYVVAMQIEKIRESK